jgi:predicted ArsR family transcriptional regulator
LLDDLGFDPEPDRADPASLRGPARIRLRNCPFLEPATGWPPITCSIHLGLMRGALEAWNAEVSVERLEAFAEPDRCLVHLAQPTRT